MKILPFPHSTLPAPSLLPLLGLLASSPFTQGQVTVGLELTQDQFLPAEAIPVSVRITNFSGQTLTFGRGDRWLQFSLDRKGGRPIMPVDTMPVEGEFALESATIAKKWVDIAPHFEMLDPGRYVLRANVKIEAWNRLVASAPVEFDVIQGTVLWERNFGVPGEGEAGTAPRFRRYVLQQAIHLEKMKLYFRLSDASGKRSFKVYPLGPMLTFSEPEHQIDSGGRLHVFYQYGARSFYYCVINPDGELLLRHTHDYLGASRPRLGVNRQDNITVVGGIRRVTREDVPAPVASPALEEPVPTAPLALPPEDVILPPSELP